MSLEHLYYLSQTIAAAAVMASLIYLALQTRQAARNQRAQIHDSRALWLVEVIQKSIDPALHDVLAAGGRADPSKRKRSASSQATRCRTSSAGKSCSGKGATG
jgi:hypothetical protein